jgi:monovalent cation:H+ antiporter-2, CPA2 family
VPLGAKSIGKPLLHLALHALGVRVVSLRRANGKLITPQDDVVFEGGDTLVLSGKAETLAVAEQKILKGQ